MALRYGLGLRTQILLALSLAFALSFTVLGLVVTRLVERDRLTDHARRAEAMAHMLARGIEGPGATDAEARLSRAVGREGVRGIALTRRVGTRSVLGQTDGRFAAHVTLEDGDSLTLYMEPPEPARDAPLSNILRLYLFFTGAAILLAIYVALTRLIVRPVEDLTRASERLARGKGSGHVPVGGAAEIVRLSVSFNRMGVELAEERAALEQRLADLERATKELRATQDQLIRSEKLASVGRLAAGVAHEIGNPLAAILGLLELLRMGGLSEAQAREFIERIHNETERIHHIIRNLLDYSRSTPDEHERDASTDLTAAVEDAVKLVAPQKDLRGVTIERRFAEDVPLVRAPAHQITQVLLNLLLNAADAVAGDGTILIEVDADPEWVRLAVSDTGPGIAPEVMHTLFDPFVTTKQAGEGTGLGLSVCHSLVERLGGTLRADNSPEGGARFTLMLRPAR